MGEVNVVREQQSDVKNRKSIRNLTDGELVDLREAFRQVYDINDERGYQHHAGIHGLPLPIYCQHGTSLFLPWHRAYLYFFEQALQDRVPGVTLPWWDWTSAASHEEGLPQAYTTQEVAGQPNPMLRAQIAVQNNDWTFRNPSPPAQLPRRDGRDGINSILRINSFERFQRTVENPHNYVHGWVGGSMGNIAVSAYDPIFWAHHSMVDRLWALWQLRHPNSGPGRRFLNQALPPFTMTVADTLDINELGYDYAAAEILVAS